jgi:lysophospholipase L1-like esterase
MKLPPDSTFVLIGDSITEAGRDPSGEATPWGAPGHGSGYVGLIEAWFGATRPQDRIRLINRGNSGNTVRDLKARWQSDVLDLQPDWLSVMIGVNDVWRQFDTPLRVETHVQPEDYAATLDELVAQTRPQVKGLLLATPHFIEPNRTDPMRKLIDAYGDVVRATARKHDCILVDVQAAFDEVLVHTHPMAMTRDRIHPDTTGHMIIARAFLKALGAL